MSLRSDFPIPPTPMWAVFTLSFIFNKLKLGISGVNPKRDVFFKKVLLFVISIIF